MSTPHQEYREIGCRFDRNQHDLIPNSPYIGAMRRATGCKDLNLYRHRITQNFMIFTWWAEGIMCEIYNCGPKSPDFGGDAPDAEELLAILRPTAEIYERMRQHNLKVEAAKERERLEALTQRDGITAYLRRHGMAEQADGIDTGRVPWAPADDQLKDYFKDLAKGRRTSIIVPG